MRDPEPAAVDKVEQLLADLLELPESERESALEELCALHPREESGMRARFALFRSFLEAESGKQPEELQQFGDFELLRVLGRGGMGVVYLARQKLGGSERLVAVKLIQGGALISEKARERFRREADAAFRLDHPGLCPILDVGEVDGTPFLVMRYIPGETLADRIDSARECDQALDLPVFKDSGSGSQDSAMAATQGVPATLALIEEVARALHFAHEAGLIHRDVKPGNIMVTPDGRPVLLDFGLVSDDAEAGSRLTLTGQPIGTPAYMSPEQISPKGQALDRSTDVYSLGATLFEALSLKPPFAAETRERLFRSILEEAPPGLRKLNSNAPRDLEVIVHTALAKDPLHRYGTALDFAEDLRRLRRHEPILARAAGPLRRTGLWVQRNRLASAILALLIISQAVIVGLAIDSAQSQEEALRERGRALGHYRSAARAVAELTKVAENELVDIPWAQPLRRELFEKSLAFYDEFILVEGQDPALQSDLAFALRESAALRVATGDVSAASTRLAEAKAAIASFADDGVPEARRHLARVWFLEAGLARLQNDGPARRAALTESIALYREAAEESEQDEDRLSLAQGLTYLGILERELYELGPARTAIDEALRVYANLESHPHLIVEHARALGESGRQYRDAGEHPAADAAFAAAAAMLREYLESNPQDRPARSLLAAQRLSTGVALRARREHAAAEEAYGESLEVFEGLNRSFPGIPSYRDNMATLLLNMGNLANSRGDLDTAIERLERSLQIREQLTAEYPEALLYRRGLVNSNYNLGLRYFARDKEKSIAAQERVLEQAAVLLARDSSDAMIRDLSSRAASEIGAALASMGRIPEVGAFMQQAREHAQALVELSPDSNRALRTLGFAQHNLGWWYADSGRLEESAATLREAVETRREMYARQPRVLSNMGLLLLSWVRLGWVLDRLEDSDAVWSELHGAIAGWPAGELARLRKSDNARFDLACARAGLAAWQIREGEADAALESLRAAMTDLESLGEGNWQDAERLLCLIRRAELEDALDEDPEASYREAIVCALRVNIDGLAGPFAQQRLVPAVDLLLENLPATTGDEQHQAIQAMQSELANR